MEVELAKAIAAFYRLYNKKTPDIPIRSSEMGVLIYFYEHSGHTAKQASDYFNIAKPSITVIVQALEKARLLYKQQDSSDKRKYKIFLTDTGMQLIANMLDAYNRYAIKLSKRLGDEKSGLLVALLKEAIQILEE